MAKVGTCVKKMPSMHALRCDEEAAGVGKLVNGAELVSAEWE